MAHDVAARPLAATQAPNKPAPAASAGASAPAASEAGDEHGAADAVSVQSGLSVTLAPEVFPAGSRHVVVDCGVVSNVDFTAMHMLTQLPADLARAGLGHVRLWLVNLRGPVRDGLRSMLAHEHEQEARAAGSHAGRPTASTGSLSDAQAGEDVAVAVAGADPAAPPQHLDTRLVCADVNDAVEWLQLGMGAACSPIGLQQYCTCIATRVHHMHR